MTDILEFDRRNIWHPYASLKNPPPVRLASSASGLEITLADGRRLVDAVSSWWCVAHGHNHPAIVEAIRRQASGMCHVMFGGFTHAPAAELAKRLASICPPGLDKVFFADSGSIAVEVAVKMATQYQHAKGRVRRTKMLALKGGYHGDTACAMALSDPDGMHVLFAGMMPKHFFVSKPGSVAFEEWTSELERMFAEHGDEIAGVICEPIFQAANAMNFYSGEYLKALRRICDAHDAVLVFDEIAAGLYRTGPRWAAEHAGVTPDVMTVGKALTGGHITLAATVASSRVADTISGGTPSAFMHGPTYMANPLACAAACASLDLFASEDYSSRVAEIEKGLRRGLEPLRHLENVSDVRVMGAVGVLEMKRLPAREDIDRVIDAHGIWLRPFADFIYTMPPLVTDDATLRRITDAMGALAACQPGPEPMDGDFHE
jgi:adenosylmethionine-8-amino-7-oxononanoate aminotransferase